MALDANARVSVSTINLHIRKLTEPIFRKRLLMALLKKRGRISFGHSGKKFDWRVRFRRHSPTAYDDLDPVSFPRTNLWKTAELPYRAYSVGESVSKFEKLANGSGETSLIKLVSEIVPALMDSMVEYFADELFKDGNSTSYTSIHGLASWFGVSGTTGLLGSPSDSYAGLTTNLGTYGGSWTGTFPAGTGNPEYHFYAPLVCDYQNSSCAATTKTWINTCREMMRYGTIYLQKLQNVRPDVFMLESELYRQFLDGLEDKERIELTATAADTLDVGIKTLSYEGVPVTTEYGIPSGDGYGLVIDKLQLRSMQKQLFAMDEDSDLTTKTDRYSIDFFGNLAIESPAFSIMFDAVS